METEIMCVLKTEILNGGYSFAGKYFGLGKTQKITVNHCDFSGQVNEVIVECEHGTIVDDFRTAVWYKEIEKVEDGDE